MSKVIHLSDQAHNNAKNFCKQYGLKMSDWVAELIVDAIVNNRVDPHTAPSPTAPPPPSSAPHVPNNAPPKKKLEHFVEGGAEEVPEAPPWAAPPFWSKSQNK